MWFSVSYLVARQISGSSTLYFAFFVISRHQDDGCTWIFFVENSFLSPYLQSIRCIADNCVTQAAWASAGLISKCYSRYMWGWSFSWWLHMSPIIHMSFILSYAYPQRQGVSLIYEINTADFLTTIIFFNTLVSTFYSFRISYAFRCSVLYQH